MPNTGSISTLPLRLIWLVRSCRVGFTVVSTVPRGSSPGVVGFSADDVHPQRRAPAAATTPRRASLRLSNGSPYRSREPAMIADRLRGRDHTRITQARSRAGHPRARGTGTRGTGARAADGTRDTAAWHGGTAPRRRAARHARHGGTP